MKRCGTGDHARGWRPARPANQAYMVRRPCSNETISTERVRECPTEYFRLGLADDIEEFRP